MDWYDEITMTRGQYMKKWIDEQDQLPEREQDLEYRKWKAAEEKEWATGEFSFDLDKVDYD